jgi:hypothetical protein
VKLLAAVVRARQEAARGRTLGTQVHV